jgi:2-keto-4-pentenoate hydratase
MDRRPGGTRARKHLRRRTKAELREAVRELERSRDTGTFVWTEDDVTLATWLEHWLETILPMTARWKTLSTYRSQMRVHVVPALGGRKLSELRPEHLEELYRDMAAQGRSPHVIRAVHRVLRSSLNEAVRRRRIAHNPVIVARPPRAALVEVEPLFVEGTRRVLTAAAGRTSEVMRRSLGVSEPNFGSLWAYMNVQEGLLDLQRLIHPKAEPEFAFRAEATLAGPGVTALDVTTAGRWAVAVEVVDPRWESWDFDWLDNTADGSSAAAYAVSAFRPTAVPPERLILTMQAGDVECRGAGREAMGSPAEAVAYLVRELHARGAALEPGMVVLTGGITAPVDLVPGLEIRVSCPELGTCRVRCT